MIQLKQCQPDLQQTHRRMVREVDAPPEPQLMESMRAVGYDLERAVADIVDNSVAAGAGSVTVSYGTTPEPWLAVCDDGSGMSRDQLVRAMRLAATSSVEDRLDTDLGRFGLGLKTASLSQCRELTVISIQAGALSACRWSLDYLQRTGRWALQELDDDDLVGLPALDGLVSSENDGTLVVWRQMDRVDLGSDGLREYDSRMSAVSWHLALVFHRFRTGEAGRLKITVNGRVAPLVDPFLTTNRATQRGPVETLKVGGGAISVQAFTLPFITKLTRREKEIAQVTGNLRDSQGFYVYRARRLVIWGTWFNIMPKGELGKLTRVRVDVPNTLDDLWRLDIKKSAAAPPLEVRRELRRLASAMIAPSRTVHVYRGRRAGAEQIIRVWELVVQEGTFRYEINRQHPMIVDLQGTGTELPRAYELALRMIEQTFPVDDAYNRLSEDGTPAAASTQEADQKEFAAELWRTYQRGGRTAGEFVETFTVIEPFVSMRNARELLEAVTR